MSSAIRTSTSTPHRTKHYEPTQPPERHTHTHTHGEQRHERPERRNLALLLLIAITLCFADAPSFALLVGDDGLIEPIFVQIKDSLRTSTGLDAQLAALASLEKENGLNEVEWYAGPKLVVKLAFPKEFSDDQAQSAITALQNPRR